MSNEWVLWRAFTWLHVVWQTWRCFKEVVLVGVLHTDGSLNLAPAESYVLQADDRLIFIADDEKQLKTGYNASPAASSSYTTGDVWSAKMMQKKAKKAKRAKPPHLVMLGCNPRVGDYLSGLDEFAEKGTIVTLVSETNLKSLVDFKDYPNLKIQTITGSPLDEANLEVRKHRRRVSRESSPFDAAPDDPPFFLSLFVHNQRLCPSDGVFAARIPKGYMH
jgi:hypothetical protein